jgi:predicted nucleic acid-binding protein
LPVPVRSSVAVGRVNCGSTAISIDRVRRPFPLEPIRTLDAVHLATAELLGEAPALVTIVTRDDRVRKNAEALGYTGE